MRFLARGDTLADIARQMRCEVADIRRIERLARGLRWSRGAASAQDNTRGRAPAFATPG